MRVLKIVFIITFMMLATASVSAQDLLARQAPVDRKMNTIDPLELKEVMSIEDYFNPNANGLYSDWNNDKAHASGVLPDTFRIDLRGFHMPTPSRKITSNFGPRWGRQHKGLDIKVYIGDTIRSAFAGKVRVVRTDPRGYGKFIVIRHNNGLETVYGHLSKQLVRENQTVHAGDIIGLGGNTGRSTGSHLHFETRLCGVALNPAIMFDFYHQDVTGDFYVYTKRNYQRDYNEAVRRVMAHVNTGDVNSSRNAYARNQNVDDDRDIAQKAPDVQNIETVNRQMDESEQVANFHKVSKGESLYSIARLRGTTVQELCKKNHIGKNFKVVVGQILKY